MHYPYLARHLLPSGSLYNRLLKTISVSALSVSLCLNLCGCSTTSETFDCQPGKGVGCKSISEVNRMVDQGGQQIDLPLENLKERDGQSKAPLSIPVIATNSLGHVTLSNPTEIPLMEGMGVHRIQEEHLRVWIAPFQDEQGNLHEGSVIHTVLKPGYWQIKANNSRANDPRAVKSQISDFQIGDIKDSDPKGNGLEEVD